MAGNSSDLLEMTAGVADDLGFEKDCACSFGLPGFWQAPEKMVRNDARASNVIRSRF